MSAAMPVPAQRAARLPTVDAQVCESLAREFHVPTRQVEAIYREELNRLAAGARINTFLGVLATRGVRARLRWRRGADLGRESEVAISCAKGVPSSAPEGRSR